MNAYKNQDIKFIRVINYHADSRILTLSQYPKTNPIYSVLL